MKDPLKININPLHEDIKVYAVVYYLSRGEKISGIELRKFAAELMNAISKSCIKFGAKVIGHIKAYIEHETGFLHANTIGEPADVTVNGRDGDPINRFKLVVNSIIYGLPEESIKEATEEAIKAVSSIFRFDREMESQTTTISSI